VVYVQMPLSLHNKQLVLTYECTSNENKLIWPLIIAQNYATKHLEKGMPFLK
jgi:hypothetical protein